MNRSLFLFLRFNLFILFFLFTNVTFNQTQTKANKLRRFAAEKRRESLRQKAHAESLAVELDIPIRFENNKGTVYELMKFVNGVPRYYKTHNIDAMISTRVDKLRSSAGLGFDLTGDGYLRLGVWDAGAVLDTHLEFNNLGYSRVNQVDGAASTQEHSTHVAGTMIAGGVDGQARGMAPEAELLAHEWNSDLAEMADAAYYYNMELSNHSYGYPTGWEYGNWSGFWAWHWLGITTVSTVEDYLSGFYTLDARDYDQIAYDAPNYLIVKSAGNDRTDSYPGEGITWYFWDPSRGRWRSGSSWDGDPPSSDGPYDCIGPEATAKNILTVGAIHDITHFEDPSYVTMVDFSSWGPTDDGRIKPDIVGNGASLYSTSDADNDSYTTMSGTSMASPNVTGSMVLLQQHYGDLNLGASMRSATLKALVIHTAVEAGDYPGPDYQFGWGLMDTWAAARLIDEDQQQNVIDELTILNSGTYQRNITIDGSLPLKVTVVWTDPPGAVPSDALDPPDLILVNDLDLRITKDMDTWYPWKLDKDNPSLAATNSSENNVDNVEQVLIESPESGTYTIAVDHDGTLASPQAFSLILSGINEYLAVPDPSPRLITPIDGSTNVLLTSQIEWYPADGASSYDLYFGTDNPPTNIVNGDNQAATVYGPNLSSGTTYYILVIPRNNQGTATGCPIWSFTTGSYSVTGTLPFIEDFQSFNEPDGIGTGNDWSNSTDDDFDWEVISGPTPSNLEGEPVGPSADHTYGTSSGKYLYMEADAPNSPHKWAYLLSPYFDLSSANNPTLEFWYYMYEGWVGEWMGDLHVDIYSEGMWHNLWNKTGSQSDNWIVATIDLSPYKYGNLHQIRFRGLTNWDYGSDMAIDDVMIKEEAFRTFMVDDLSPWTFPNTGATIQFSTTNTTDVTVTTIKKEYDPGFIGGLPTGVENISAERYWTITRDVGTTDGIYDITLDLEGIGGISDYSTLELLKRADFENPWLLEGTNAYIGSGTAVKWTGITTGFSDFGIGGAGDNSLPVELASFTVKASEGTVLLRWVTSSEVENLGFIIERKRENQQSWQLLSDYSNNEDLQGQGNYSSEYTYGFDDKDIDYGKRYIYRLSDVSYTGRIFRRDSVEITLIAGADMSQIPATYVLKNAFPNPFNPSTNIMFGLPEDADVKITIFNSVGQKVRTLTKDHFSAGWHVLKWNGRSDVNDRLSSGQYFYIIKTERFSDVKKMLLLK